MIHPNSSKWGAINGLLCLLKISVSSHDTRGVSVMNFHQGVWDHAECSRGRSLVLMLMGVMGKRFFQALYSVGSNHPRVFVGVALICVIISFVNTTTLFLCKIAQLDQGRGINPRKFISMSFKLRIEDGRWSLIIQILVTRLRNLALQRFGIFNPKILSWPWFWNLTHLLKICLHVLIWHLA